jgi:hypothetical protein
MDLLSGGGSGQGMNYFPDAPLAPQDVGPLGRLLGNIMPSSLYTPPTQAQGPGGAIGKLLAPNVALPMAAALMGNGGNAANIGAAFGAAAPGLQQNRTVQWLRKKDPELADLVQNGGMSVSDAYAYQAARDKAGRGSLINAGDGRIYDATKGEWITAPGMQHQYRQASRDEAAGYGAQGGQFGPDGKFYPINPPSGMSIESDGQGGFRIAQGPGRGSKPFTEGQSKDIVYSTRARGALSTLDNLAPNLTGRVDRALDMDPTGIAREMLQSPDYQVAKTAGDEFLQAILRKDTGAAITAQESELYGKTYLPQPGDQPETLVYKQQARARAVNALEAGMSPAQIIAQERALSEQGLGIGGGGSDGGMKQTGNGVSWRVK